MGISGKMRKVIAATAAVSVAASVMMGGTLAWQSINQEVTNIVASTPNPGARLHNDFNGSNLDVYVENFGEEEIYARILLKEYMALGIEDPGTGGTVVTYADTAGTTVSDYSDVSTWWTHQFVATDNKYTDEYLDWFWGGETVYMPSFNLDKDSLAADINGTYGGEFSDGASIKENRYNDYKTYVVGDTEAGNEIRDNDLNGSNELLTGTGTGPLDNYSHKLTEIGTDGASAALTAVQALPNAPVSITQNVEHTAKATGRAQVISMADWQALVAANGNDASLITDAYWVYDTDGWAYYSKPIDAAVTTAGVTETFATGLLLDRIVPRVDDTYFYEIYVIAQFITANDIGTAADKDGFYNDMYNLPGPSADALVLLDQIGVEVPTTSTTSARTVSDAADVGTASYEATLSAAPADTGTYTAPLRTTSMRRMSKNQPTAASI